jgi:hypothetical protein
MERRWLPPVLLSCLAVSAATLPSPAQLIRAAVAVRAAQKDWKYTYRDDEESFQTDRNGQRVPARNATSSGTFDVIMLEGQPYRKLVLVDGKPLDAATQERVDRALEKERAGRREQPATIPVITRHYNVRAIGIEELEDFFETKVAGEETVLGRKAWRLESVPRRGRRLNYKEGEMVATRVVIWLDEQDSAEIQQTTTYESRDRGPNVETELTEEYSKIGEAWLLDNTRGRTKIKTGLMEYFYGEIDTQRYDYKRFTVDSGIVTP